MIIGPGKGGISAFVILADGEFLPENLNSEKVVVMRRGESTGWELLVVKEFGKLADSELIKPSEAQVCASGKLDHPLHQHADGSWWFYDVTWVYENGPFESYSIGSRALTEYCDDYLAEKEKLDKPEETEDTSTWENEGGNENSN
jgi:hypothetical protein